MDLEQLFLEDGEYVNKDGNIIDKRKLRFAGESHLIRLDGFSLEKEPEAYYNLRATNLLSRLKDNDGEYEGVNSYIINLRPIIRDKECTVYPILFFKNEGFINKDVKEKDNLGEVKTREPSIQKKRGRKSNYDLENSLALYHKLSEEAGHNLTMSELKEIDKSYASFLNNRRYQNGLDLSIMPKGKRGKSRTRNIEKDVKEEDNLEEVETRKPFIQGKRGRKSNYDTENPLALYHKLGEEAGHNLTMSELKEIDKGYASFLNNRRYQNGLDLSIMQKGKKGRSSKWVNLSFEEKIKYSVEGQFEDGRETPLFNLPRESAEHLISNNILGKLGYEIVKQKDTDYGVNFKVKRAS